ncbi:MAG TPA: hypothetical protein VKH44_09445 [Pirellulaceae bacterium]|nr:hypothetical protein [Pirellulaceae bacterium]
MRKVARRLSVAAAALALLLALSLWCIYRASQRPPEFYRQALAAPVEVQVEEGQRFERDALDLHNQLLHAGRWEACLTQDEINGWLATDLPAKFPQALPSGVSEPRVAIEDGVVRIAVHYQRGGVDTVLSVSGEAYLTAQPNEIAVRLEQARAGIVPVPLARFLDEITERAARADLPLRWTEVRGAPVALVRLPLDLDDASRRVVIDRLRWGDGQLVLGGRTEEEHPPNGDRTQPSTAIQPGDKETRQR